MLFLFIFSIMGVQNFSTVALSDGSHDENTNLRYFGRSFIVLLRFSTGDYLYYLAFDWNFVPLTIVVAFTAQGRIGMASCMPSTIRPSQIGGPTTQKTLRGNVKKRRRTRKASAASITPRTANHCTAAAYP